MLLCLGKQVGDNFELSLLTQRLNVHDNIFEKCRIRVLSSFLKNRVYNQAVARRKEFKESGSAARDFIKILASNPIR